MAKIRLFALSWQRARKRSPTVYPSPGKANVRTTSIYRSDDAFNKFEDDSSRKPFGFDDASTVGNRTVEHAEQLIHECPTRVAWRDALRARVGRSRQMPNANGDSSNHRNEMSGVTNNHGGVQGCKTRPVVEDLLKELRFSTPMGVTHERRGLVREGATRHHEFDVERQVLTTPRKCSSSEIDIEATNSPQCRSTKRHIATGAKPSNGVGEHLVNSP